MRDEALFLNGIFDNVMGSIVEIQKYLPDQILYLQPYSSRRIVRLAKNLPTCEDPVRLLVSTTDELATVHYVAEIVGWEDKRELADWKLHTLNRVIYALQPYEWGVYGLREPGEPDMVNLLFVRRAQRLSKPFSVGELRLTDSHKPHSTERSTAGGWSYVVNPKDAWLEAYL
jgi:hypothetical protein